MRISSGIVDGSCMSWATAPAARLSPMDYRGQTPPRQLIPPYRVRTSRVPPAIGVAREPVVAKLEDVLNLSALLAPFLLYLDRFQRHSPRGGPKCRSARSRLKTPGVTIRR